MVLAHVSEIAIDGLSSGIHSPRGTDMNRRHTTCLSRSSDHRVMDHPAGPRLTASQRPDHSPHLGPAACNRACRKPCAHVVVEEAATDTIALDNALGHEQPWQDHAFIDDKVVALQRQRQNSIRAAETAVVFFDRSPVCIWL